MAEYPMWKFYFLSNLDYKKILVLQAILSFCSSIHTLSTTGDISNFILKRDLNIKLKPLELAGVKQEKAEKKDISIFKRVLTIYKRIE